MLRQRLRDLRRRRDGAGGVPDDADEVPAGEIILKTSRWATCGGQLPGVLTLTDRRIVWKAWGSGNRGLDLPVGEVAGVAPRSNTDFVLSLRDGRTVRLAVNAWNRRSWMKAVEQAASAARRR